jgi:hypothetical protein
VASWARLLFAARAAHGAKAVGAGGNGRAQVVELRAARSA